MHSLQPNLISIHFQINQLNIKSQDINNLSVFNAITMIKDSVNLKYKHTF